VLSVAPLLEPVCDSGWDGDWREGGPRMTHHAVANRASSRS
jgi:hypothetical protein